MPRWVIAATVGLAAIHAACASRHLPADVIGLAPPCTARLAAADATPIAWVLGPPGDRASLDRWCDGVGRALTVNTTAPDARPPLDSLVVATWNAHVGQGSLAGVVAAIRDGQFSGGRPPAHFVLLVQEALRRGPEVPSLPDAASSARAIGNGAAEDIRAAARALDLSLVYVPSMRNGADRAEDRGNAILSTLPLEHAVAIELPFARQRRVAVGATASIEHDGRPARLQVMNVHLDPLGSARSLWVFDNPRQRQMAAVLEAIEDRLATAPGATPIVATVLGGDLNLVNGGAQEPVYQEARSWALSVADEDERRTHLMGRLDYLFLRFEVDWRGSTKRGESRFGSDHYPVAATFFPSTAD